MVRLAIMISGLGTNMVRLAKVIEDFKLEAEIKLVINHIIEKIKKKGFG